MFSGFLKKYLQKIHFFKSDKIRSFRFTQKKYLIILTFEKKIYFQKLKNMLRKMDGATNLNRR